MTEQPHPDRPITFRQLTPALEFCAWVMVMLAPVLRRANGAPVTRDQAILQFVVASLAIAAALFFRGTNWRVLPISQPCSACNDNDQERQTSDVVTSTNGSER